MKISIASSVVSAALLAGCSSAPSAPADASPAPEPPVAEFRTAPETPIVAPPAVAAPVVETPAAVEPAPAVEVKVTVAETPKSADAAAAAMESARAKLAAGDAASDPTGAAQDMRKAAALAPKDFALDLVLWRKAVEASRKAGGSQEPDLRLIEAEITEIRGKSFKASVPSGSQTPEAFGAMVEESIDKEVPKDKREDVQAGLNRLGLIPGDFDMKKAVTGALMSQAAAYYDPKQKKFFNLFSGLAPELVEATAAHELVHALQDQYFDLTTWFEAHDDHRADGVRNDDRTLALRCVVEGEATFVQTVWQMEHMLHQSAVQAVGMARMALPMVAGMETEQLVQMVRSQTALVPPGSDMAKAMDELDKIEPYVVVPLFAAYMSGANLIGVLDADPSGWAAVEKLYAAPPDTSEQCLHPEKYAKKRDIPTPVALPDLPEIAAAGWRAADAAVHGELYFRVILKRNGVPAPAAKKAAAGWDGDLYRSWRAPDGRTAIVLATTWDTETDAKEFFDAYKTALAKKYGKLSAAPGDDPKSFGYCCGELELGVGALVQRGLEVFAVEGFPKELSGGIVGKLVATKIEHVE